MLDMVLEAALELAQGLLWPHYQEMDRNPPELTDDGVKVHPSVKKVLKEMGEGGWIAMTVPEEIDGQQLPHMIAESCQFIFCAANYSLAAYFSFCEGAARLIENLKKVTAYLDDVQQEKGIEYALADGTLGLFNPLMQTDGLTVFMKNEWFSD